MLRRKSLFKKAVIIAVMATGFSVMVFQILILLSFQIIYGYMFYKLGIILTAFMIGLAAGGWWVTKIMPGLKNDAAAFMWSQCAICIYPLSLPIFFGRLAGSASSGMSWLGSNILFLVLPVLAGFIGGFQLPLANKIYLGKEREVGSAAGLSYGSDLLGSCLGALLTGALLIPIIGIPKTCLLIAVMNSAVLILLIFSAASCKPVN
jgi:predicted membrane-bound spermidine synthase